MPVNAEELIRWQTKMSNTAHQREMADLQAAGLNPVLTTKYGGASVPTGAMDSGGTGGGGSGSPVPGSSYDPNDPIGNVINGIGDHDRIKLGPFTISGETIKNIYNTVKGNNPEFIRQVNAFLGGSLSPQDIWTGILQNSKTGDPAFGAEDAYSSFSNNAQLKWNSYTGILDQIPYETINGVNMQTVDSRNWVNSAMKVINWIAGRNDLNLPYRSKYKGGANR